MTERRQLLQDALAAIERLESRLDKEQRRRHEPLAIVGAGCRYPGGIVDLDGLWRTVRDGVDAVTEVPADRWDIDAYYSPDPQAPGRMVTRRGGFLAGIDRFDAALFGISPREAISLDPQHRLLLETSHEAMENAGIAPDSLAGTNTGVFVGITTNDYFHRIWDSGAENTDIYVGTGTALNAASGRLSFTWGLQGPCVSVDTACSSSLVAIHLACQSLRTGDSDLALAGGVNVVLLPDPMVLFSKWGMMAPDGRCKTFDDAADGFVRAEGCAVIALKRLSDAQTAGDDILAIIRGSAVNSDGRSSGMTVPHGPAQQVVVRRALEDARLESDALDYIEAHGTGTPIGDPIEVEALGAVMNGGPRRQKPLLIGSIKANIGHTEAASGIAGLLKVVQALRHEAIPPHLNFRTPNKRIPWADIPIGVPTTLTPWPRGGRPRRAGVSAFGFSGTNAHFILEEAPSSLLSAPDVDVPTLFPLSARSDAALRELAANTAEFLSERPEQRLAGIARTAATGRSRYSHRAAFVAASRHELEAELRAFAAGQSSAWTASHTLRSGERPQTAFLFTGQGSQYVGMGRGLYAAEPVFRAALDRCASLLASRLPRPLLDVLFGSEGDTLTETGYAQPALFSLQFALSELWRSWGIVPSFVMGHSVGEFAALCVAGAMRLEDGLALIAERGRLMQALPAGGAMAAVFASEARVARGLAPFGGRLSLAAVNAPEEMVISGDAEALREALAQFATEGVKARPLEVSHAFHSYRLDPMLDGFERFAAGIAFTAPKISVVSNVSGQLLPPGVAPDAAYFRRHAREPVRFAEGIAALRAAGATVLVEIGPQPTLLGLAAKAEPEARWTALPSLRRGRDDRKQICAALGGLQVRGATLDWDAVQAGLPPGRASLPTYPFQRERYWMEAKGGPSGDSAPARTPRGTHPLLGVRQQVPGPGAQFLAEIRRDNPAFLADHLVCDTVLLPGSAHIEAVLAAARVLADGHLELENISIDAPLALSADTTELLHLAVEPWQRGAARFVVQSASKAAAFDRPWKAQARGVIRKRGGVEVSAPLRLDTVAAARAQCTTAVDVEAYYARLARAGLAYGPAFRGIRALALGKNLAVATLEAPAAPPGHDSPWILHPAILDAAFHLLDQALSAARPDAPDRVYLPVGMERVSVRPTGAPQRVEAVARLRSSEADAAVFLADLRLEDEAGVEVAGIAGLQLRPVEMDALRRALSFPGIATRSYSVGWQAVAFPDMAAALSASGSYVLVGDDEFAAAMAGVLDDAGARCSVLSSSEFASLSEPELAELLRRADDDKLAWVVDCGAVNKLATSDPQADARVNYLRLLRLARAIAEVAPRAGLCLVTHGAQAAASGEAPSLAQAPLLGLARAAAAERGDAPAFRIDLDPRAPADVRLIVLALQHLSRSEPELAVRNREFLATRLAGAEEPALSPPTGMRDGAASLQVRGDGTYLVTGGLGGIGLATAKWLAQRGAGQLVLVGRRGPGEADRDALEKIRALGAQVVALACDVADPEAVRTLWRDALKSCLPLRGIVHSAGAVADALLGEQDAERFDRVAASKIVGALNLHRASAGDPLDFFALYSSTSALLGNPGQANYAAANAFLDSLALHRRAIGLPATSIAWGAWGEVGMASRLSEAQLARWASAGIGLLEPSEAFPRLERALVGDAAHVAILAVDPERSLPEAGPGVRALMADVAPKTRLTTAAEPQTKPLAEIYAAKTPAARREIVLAYVGRQLAQILGIKEAAFDVDAPLSDFGLDSLMMVQFRTRVEVDLPLKVSIEQLLSGQSAIELAEIINGQLGESDGSLDPNREEIVM